jgi:hypothetical protein
MGAVIRFLHADGAVILGGVTRPLMLLNEALVDAARGAEPALLFNARDPRTALAAWPMTPCVGKSPRFSTGCTRPGEVAKRLAARLAAHKITGPNGEFFAARTLRNWWNNVRTRNEHASTVMLDAFWQARGSHPLQQTAARTPRHPALGDGRTRPAGLTRILRSANPASQAIEQLADLASPIGAFVRERCVVGPQYSPDCAIMFRAWVSWCLENHRDHHGTTQTFARDLRAMVPGLSITQPRDARGERPRHYQGVGIQ